MKYPKLFTPMNIGPVTIKNRLVILSSWSAECAVNPRACRETELPLAVPKDGGQRQVVGRQL